LCATEDPGVAATRLRTRGEHGPQKADGTLALSMQMHPNQPTFDRPLDPGRLSGCRIILLRRQSLGAWLEGCEACLQDLIEPPWGPAFYMAMVNSVTYNVKSSGGKVDLPARRGSVSSAAPTTLSCRPTSRPRRPQEVPGRPRPRLRQSIPPSRSRRRIAQQFHPAAANPEHTLQQRIGAHRHVFARIQRQLGEPFQIDRTLVVPVGVGGEHSGVADDTHASLT
jgi:hypothetical protein